MIKTYSKKGKLLNIVYQIADIKEGREDITDACEYLQCGVMKIKAGKIFQPHKHITRKGEDHIHIQEAFIIILGKATIIIYDDDSIIDRIKLYAGDLTILLSGGHSLYIEKDTILYEIKTGPYLGQENDKIFIS